MLGKSDVMSSPSDRLILEVEQPSRGTGLIVMRSAINERSTPASYGPPLLAAGLVVVVGGLMAVVFALMSSSEMREVQRRQSEAARIALSLSVNQLHAVALRSVPFNAEFVLVKTVAGADAAMALDLAVIEPLQHEGLPTIRRIVSDFEQAAAAVLIAEQTGPGANW